MAETRSRLAVRRALGVVYERLKNEDGVLATYRAWMKAGAKTPLPYNRVGEILEKRQDHKAALDAFIRSLQIEWNQPPIIEARKDCSRRPTRPIDENEGKDRTHCCGNGMIHARVGQHCMTRRPHLIGRVGASAPSCRMQEIWHDSKTMQAATGDG